MFKQVLSPAIAALFITAGYVDAEPLVSQKERERAQQQCDRQLGVDCLSVLVAATGLPSEVIGPDEDAREDYDNTAEFLTRFFAELGQADLAAEVASLSSRPSPQLLLEKRWVEAYGALLKKYEGYIFEFTSAEEVAKTDVALFMLSTGDVDLALDWLVKDPVRYWSDGHERLAKEALRHGDLATARRLIDAMSTKEIMFSFGEGNIQRNVLLSELGLEQLRFGRISEAIGSASAIAAPEGRCEIDLALSDALGKTGNPTEQMRILASLADELSRSDGRIWKRVECLINIARRQIDVQDREAARNTTQLAFATATSDQRHVTPSLVPALQGEFIARIAVLQHRLGLSDASAQSMQIAADQIAQDATGHWRLEAAIRWHYSLAQIEDTAENDISLADLIGKAEIYAPEDMRRRHYVRGEALKSFAQLLIAEGEFRTALNVADDLSGQHLFGGDAYKIRQAVISQLAVQGDTDAIEAIIDDLPQPYQVFWARLEIARTLFLDQRVEEAREVLDDLVGDGSETAGFIEVARMYRRFGHRDLAIKSLETWYNRARDEGRAISFVELVALARELHILMTRT